MYCISKQYIPRNVSAIFHHQRRNLSTKSNKAGTKYMQVKYADNRRKFVDRVRVSLIGGNGGLGCQSHEHLGPGKKRADGGDAGDGGNVIIRTQWLAIFEHIITSLPS